MGWESSDLSGLQDLLPFASKLLGHVEEILLYV